MFQLRCFRLKVFPMFGGPFLYSIESRLISFLDLKCVRIPSSDNVTTCLGETSATQRSCILSLWSLTTLTLWTVHARTMWRPTTLKAGDAESLISICTLLWNSCFVLYCFYSKVNIFKFSSLIKGLG